MIATGQIVAAGVITAVSVAVAESLVRRPAWWVVASASGTFLLVVAWRALSNLLGLNGDFIPAISVGDVGCVAAGAGAPAALAIARVAPARFRWAPALTGALVGFVVNVVIL